MGLNNVLSSLLALKGFTPSQTESLPKPKQLIASNSGNLNELQQTDLYCGSPEFDNDGNVIRFTRLEQPEAISANSSEKVKNEFERECKNEGGFVKTSEEKPQETQEENK